MRVAAVILALTSTTSLRVCGSDEAPPPPSASAPASVEAEVAVDVPEPQHGGSVVAVDDYYVEVLAVPSGEVHAWSLEVEGHPPPPPGAEMTVYMTASDGHRHPVELTWDSDVTVYRGHLVDVRPEPGPFLVQVSVDGHVHRGYHEHYVVLPPARARVHLATWGVHGHGPHGHGHGHVDVDVHAPHPPNVRVDVEVPHPPSIGVRVGGDVHVEGDHHRHHRGRGHFIGRGRGHHMHMH